MNDIPSRCIDPIIKDCENCRYGHVEYPGWVESYEDRYACCYDTYCSRGYDQDRPEDEPTEDELKNFAKYLEKIRR